MPMRLTFMHSMGQPSILMLIVSPSVTLRRVAQIIESWSSGFRARRIWTLCVQLLAVCAVFGCDVGAL